MRLTLRGYVTLILIAAFLLGVLTGRWGWDGERYTTDRTSSTISQEG